MSYKVFMKFTGILMTLLTGLLVFGCMNVLADTSENTEMDIPAVHGLVRISLNTTAAQMFPQIARTAIPLMENFFFTLEFTHKEGNDLITRDLDNVQTNIEQSLKPGKWNIIVTGYIDSDRNDEDKIFQGEADFEVEAGKEINVSVYMSFIGDPDGFGHITYDISFPPDLDSAFLRVFSLADPPVMAYEINLAPVGSETDANGTIENIPGGIYQVLIELLDEDNGKMAVFTELAHVYDGLITVVNRQFTDDNFFNFINMPIRRTGDIHPYLSSQAGGLDSTDPILLELDIQLTEENWLGILGAIAGAGKFVELDLAACTASSDNNGGGLLNNGTFNAMPSVDTGKNRIVGIVLPDATEIIVHQFSYFSSLESISFPAKVEIPEHNPFRGCDKLINFDLTGTGNLSSIENYRALVRNETELIAYPSASGSINMDTIIIISATAFDSNYELTSVSFPNATTIGNFSFNNCTSLIEVNFPKVTFIDNAAFSNCTSLTKVNFPDVITIGEGAFYSCTSLTEAKFPEVTTIGGDIFRDTGNTFLKLYLGDTAPTIGTNTFSLVDSPKHVTILVPQGATGYTGFPVENATDQTWANSFRGMGWDGVNFLAGGMVNENIILNSISTIEMVLIPAGTFTMGSPAGEIGRTSWENLQRQVTLSAFYMGIYQVTQDQWAEVMAGNNYGISTTPSTFNSNPAAGEEQGRRPVESVSWHYTLVFANRLSIMEGLSPAYRINGSTNPDDWGAVPTASGSPNIADWDAVEIVDGSNGYRLPTEAQWEYACRAGTTTAFNNGEEDWNIQAGIDPIGWFMFNSTSRTHEVGLKQPNDWGLYDIHGNVHELCWDWYEPYPDEEQTDPTGASTGNTKIMRGGYSQEVGYLSRSAARSFVGTYDRLWQTGFRLVRPAE